MSELLWIGASFGLKAGALIALGLLLARVLAPSQRLAFLRALLLAVLALPLLSGMLPAWLLPVLPAAEPIPLTAVAPVAASPLAATGGDWLAWPLAAYGLSVVFLLARFVSQFRVLRRWAHAARPLTSTERGNALPTGSDYRRRLRIGWSEEIAAPVSFGWPRSDVLLPAAWRGEAGARVSHALAHELAHVERRDWLWLVLIRVTHALAWWNPLLYPLLRSLDEETELACDRRALEQVRSPADYARSLLSLARDPTLAAVPMSGSRYWRRRVEHAFNHRSEEISMPRIPIACAWILIGAVMVPLAACQLVRAAEPAPAPVAAPAPTVDPPAPVVVVGVPEVPEAPPPKAGPTAAEAPVVGPVNPALSTSPAPPAPPAPELAAQRAALREEAAGQRRAEAESRRAEFKAQRAEMERRREEMGAERARLRAEQGERRELLAAEQAALAAERAAMARETKTMARETEAMARDTEAMRAELEAVQRELERAQQELAQVQEELKRAQ